MVKLLICFIRPISLLLYNWSSQFLPTDILNLLTIIFEKLIHNHKKVRLNISLY